MPKLGVSRLPSYRRQKSRNLAVVTLDGKDIYLGPYGSEVSKREYDRLVTEWMVNGRQLPAVARPTPISILELIAQFWRHVQEYYVKDGVPTSEQEWVRYSMKPLRQLYGHSAAADFGPLALRAVIQRMVDNGDTRQTINGRITRIKRLFKWAVSNELVPAMVHQALQTVPGLRSGRTRAPESARVEPIDDRYVDAIRDFVAPQIWAMIELQRLTGMRPGEVVSMRAMDLDMSSSVWSYRPASHKTEHHGHLRIIEVGPRGQQVLTPFLKADPSACLFSPVDAEAVRHARQRKLRKSRVQPSQKNRRRTNPKRPPQTSYTVASYRRAITRGCDRADSHARAQLNLPVDAARQVPRWHPHQLRHSYATKIRRTYGLEAARILLGHRTMAVTEVYADIDRAKVSSVVQAFG